MNPNLRLMFKICVIRQADHLTSVIGMTIASQLPKDAKITIVGEYLPGDEMTPGYPSQWAGAIWLGTHNATPREQVMQLGGLAHLWKIAERYPESSVRKITMNEVMDYGSVEDVWYRKHVMDFRMIPQEELPKGANYGMRYTTLVITPPVFIAWLRRRLEDYGVIFKRLHVKSLKDLEGMGHDVLINASGWGSTKLEDVRDEKLVPMKQQNIRIRNPGYNRLYIRRGLNNYYSTAFARHDGSIYIGGVKTEGLNNFEVNHDHRAEVSVTFAIPVLTQLDEILILFRSCDVSTKTSLMSSLPPIPWTTTSSQIMWVCIMSSTEATAVCEWKNRLLVIRR